MAAEADPSDHAAPAERRLRVMRLSAGALLLFMCGLYVLSVTQAAALPAAGYVRAFAEAAMVGGLADWFAVTAIFRRPFGLPIPHTGVIPRNQDRIAAALGEFVSVNFLAPDIVRTRLEETDLARALGEQLAERATARRVVDGALDALPAVADLSDDADFSEFLRRQIGVMARQPQFSGALGRVLRVLTEDGRHHALINAAIAEGWRALETHEPELRGLVRARTPWFGRLISLDDRAADALIDGVEGALRAVAADPDHPTRRRITDALQGLADDFERSPALRVKVEKFVADMLAHPAAAAYLNDLWRTIKARLRADPGAGADATRDALAETLMRMGEALAADDDARAALDRRLKTLVVELSARHGPDIGALIADTIRGWDAKTVVEKLERNVGADLQFIRINGTLIGGLVGLVIHQATLFFAPG